MSKVTIVFKSTELENNDSNRRNLDFPTLREAFLYLWDSEDGIQADYIQTCAGKLSLPGEGIFKNATYYWSKLMSTNLPSKQALIPTPLHETTSHYREYKDKKEKLLQATKKYYTKQRKYQNDR